MATSDGAQVVFAVTETVPMMVVAMKLVVVVVVVVSWW